MLPGLDFSEVLIVIVLALLVLGPKDLPLMMRKLGRFMAKMRGMAAEFRSGFDELARQAELDELRKEVDALRRTANGDLSGVADEFTRPISEARDAVMAPLPAPGATETRPAAAETGPMADPEPPALDAPKTAEGAR